jgi:hypothetical protein
VIFSTKRNDTGTCSTNLAFVRRLLLSIYREVETVLEKIAENAKREIQQIFL